jgi:hypothetical protein
MVLRIDVAVAGLVRHVFKDTKLMFAFGELEWCRLYCALLMTSPTCGWGLVPQHSGACGTHSSSLHELVWVCSLVSKLLLVMKLELPRAQCHYSYTVP